MLHKNQLLQAAVFTAFWNGAEAFWRLPCRGRSGLGLIDPIVDYGKVSPHSHTIHGPSNFGLQATSASMNVCICASSASFVCTYHVPAIPMHVLWCEARSFRLLDTTALLYVS